MDCIVLGVAKGKTWLSNFHYLLEHFNRCSQLTKYLPPTCSLKSMELEYNIHSEKDINPKSIAWQMFATWDTCVTTINSGSKTLPLTRSPPQQPLSLLFTEWICFTCVFTACDWNTLFSVMVNFMCWLDGPWGVPTFGQTLFWVCLWGCFWTRWTSESIDGVKQVALLHVDEPIQPSEGLKRTKVWVSRTPPACL